jgi:hypothetical protein
VVILYSVQRQSLCYCWLNKVLRTMLMSEVTTKPQNFVETPETKFWQECRQRAAKLGVPAWLLAEEGFRHDLVDRRTTLS